LSPWYSSSLLGSRLVQQRDLDQHLFADLRTYGFIARAGDEETNAFSIVVGIGTNVIRQRVEGEVHRQLHAARVHCRDELARTRCELCPGDARESGVGDVPDQIALVLESDTKTDIG
jgi:hypothetical protein